MPVLQLVSVGFGEESQQAMVPGAQELLECNLSVFSGLTNF